MRPPHLPTSPHFPRFPIPDSRFPTPDSRFPIPDSRFPITANFPLKHRLPRNMELDNHGFLRA
ncbi:hypothetical protein [Moorena producens]|uniref:hypothetical protein n=1 Tax=Moorena producens TaxID=1155739 RepID=UPI001314228A|nr:hypothetical protein [Moorena producens]